MPLAPEHSVRPLWSKRMLSPAQTVARAQAGLDCLILSFPSSLFHLCSDQQYCPFSGQWLDRSSRGEIQKSPQTTVQEKERHIMSQRVECEKLACLSD